MEHEPGCPAEDGMFLEPIMEYVGHFHMEEEDASHIEHVCEIMKSILMSSSDEEWDEAPELWLSWEGASNTIHDRWEECPLKDDQNSLPFDPFRVFRFGNIHPEKLLRSIFPAPEFSGAFLFSEGWRLDSNDLEEGEHPNDYAGRVADHLKAKECKQIFYVSPAGEFASVIRARGSEEVEATVCTSASEAVSTGLIPEAMLYFTRNNYRPDDWSQQVVRRISENP